MRGRSSIPLAIVIVIMLSAAPFLMSQDAVSSDQPVTVTFHDSDGGVCASSEWSYRETPYFTGTEPTPPEGKRFVGWNTVRGSSSAMFIPPAEHDTDYYPVFAPEEDTVSIAMDPNNGKDTVRTIYRMSGKEFAIPTIHEMGITSPGTEGTFILDSWEDGSGGHHTPGTMCTAENGLRLKAIWMRAVAETPVIPELPETVEIERFSERTLSYPCTGVTDGTVTYEWFLRDGPSSSCIGVDRDLELPYGMVCYPGTYYIFYIATCTDPYAVEHISYSMSDDIRISVKEEYVLSISGTDICILTPSGGNVSLPNTIDGRVLKGLVTDIGYTIPLDGTYAMPSHDITAIPVFEDVVYELGLMSEGRRIGSVHSDDGIISVPGCTEIREGYVFSGWSYDGTVFLEGDVLILDRDSSMTAIWVPCKTVCMMDGKEHVGNEVTLPAEGILMWYDDDGKGYLPGETVKIMDGMSFTSVPL